MISYRVEGGLGPLIDYLGDLADMDIRPLAEAAKIVAIEDNARARVAGVDKDGEEMDPLSRKAKDGLRRSLRPSELARRGGDGPPLAPRGAGSRIVTDYHVEVIPQPGGAVLVQGSWPNLPWLKFHLKGGPIMPRRDVAGITPRGMDEIAETTRAFLAVKLGIY